MKIYAYARVSARGQNLARQLEAFAPFRIPQSRIFAEKRSGKDFCREEYAKLLSLLAKGDLLIVGSLDRLGRNYEQIIAEWRRITKDIGADILVLDMPLLDTRARADSLVGKFVADIVLQVLSFVAENERANIRARQREGIRLAKERGVKFGRPPVPLTEEFVRAARAYQRGELPLRAALLRLGISRSAFFRRLARLRGRA